MTRRGPRARYGTLEHIDVWSVAKVSLPFYVAVVAGVILLGVAGWAALVSSGSTEDFERFIVEDVGYASFEFLPDQMFSAAVKGGLILVAVGTAFNVLVATLVNMLSEFVGGIRLMSVERPVRSGRGAPAE